MALMNAKFSGNRAEVAGGAIFAGYVEAIRFDCFNSFSNNGLEFYKESEWNWRDVKRLESEADICPSWKGNHGNLYGPDVGTYATYANMTIEKTNKSVCASGGENCIVDGYRTGEDLPEAKVILLDGLGQGPAISYRTIYAVMSSAKSEFMVGSVGLSMEEGSCTFKSIRGFVPPGEYKLIVGFGEEAIKDIGITVKVRNCSVGEIVSSARICVSCSIMTYNFNTSGEDCRPCPENGNCTSRVITPKDGYWQKTPCSDHIHKCMPTSACEFEGRSEKLTGAVSNVTTCHFNETWIEEDYSRAQCAEASWIR